MSLGLQVGLFALTALAELLGCYLPYLILRQQHSPWLWLPTCASLMVFVWLLTLHPTAAGRVYAAYGGVYVVMALLWLRLVNHVSLTRWDIAGGVVILLGALLIIIQPIKF